MKVLKWLLLLAIARTLFAQQAAPPRDARPADAWTVIRAGSLIDGKSDKPRRDQVIAIRGNRIESVSDAASAKIPAGAAIIDLSKATVFPA